MNISVLFPRTFHPHHFFYTPLHHVSLSTLSKNSNSHSHPRKFFARDAAVMASNPTINQQSPPQDNAAATTRLIFTYGTLKRGFYNHALMEDLMSTLDASFIGECTTVESFPLVIGPYGIPFLVNLPGSGHNIPGELYAVSGRGLARLDELEGIETGHYERLPVNVVRSDEAEVAAVEGYFAHRSFAEALWRRNGEEGLREFSKEMGGKYVKRANRPLDSNFVDAVWKFISHQS